MDTGVFLPVTSTLPLCLHVNCDDSFIGRAIARILHGIGSPHFPALVRGGSVTIGGDTSLWTLWNSVKLALESYNKYWHYESY